MQVADRRGSEPGNFLFADGSVQLVSQTIDLKDYRRLSTIAQGLVVELS
jgi:prepilin-type processing-associated H-X9-DG protein